MGRRPRLACSPADATIVPESAIDPRGPSEAKEDPALFEVFESHGVHFEYPADWPVEVSEDGPVTDVEVQAPDGLAFALVRTDETRPDPARVADEVLEAMREEYPDLDADPAREDIRGYRATGHDVEFFALDVTNAASIRCFRTPRRTVLIFGQWSDLGGDDLCDLVRAVFRSVEEMED
jgi:hypothetical protein